MRMSWRTGKGPGAMCAPGVGVGLRGELGTAALRVGMISGFSQQFFAFFLDWVELSACQVRTFWVVAVACFYGDGDIEWMVRDRSGVSIFYGTY